MKLDYAAPTDLSCPDRDAFAAAVATKLGYEAIVASDEPSLETLHVHFSRRPPGTVVDVKLSRPDGTSKADKRLVSETGACGELFATAAFTSAILLDPRVMFPRSQPPTTPGDSLDSRAPGTWPWYEPRGPIPASPSAPPPPVVPWRWRVAAALSLCTGCAPAWSPGVGLLLGVAKGRLGLDLGARADLPSSASTPSGGKVGASLVLGELFPHARFGGVRVGPVAAIGTLFGESQGDKQTSIWAAAGLRVGFEYEIVAPVFVRLALDGLLTLGRVALRVDGSELWSSPAAIAGGSLGAGVEF